MTRPAAGPATRRFARERGLDLRKVQGHGSHGRITMEDVEQAIPLASTNSVITAQADLSHLLDRLPTLSALSGRKETSLTPLLIKAAAVALHANPDLAPLHIAKGTENWALDRNTALRNLGILSLTDETAAAQLETFTRDGTSYKASLFLEGPVTTAVYQEGSIRAHPHLKITVEGVSKAPAMPFISTLVEILETPLLLLSV